MYLLIHKTSSSSKLSLSTANTSGNTGSADQTPRNFSGAKRHGDTPSHAKSNPFNSMSPSTGALASPTIGASGAFGLGSGAFAAFGSAKTPKSSGALDFGSIAGAGKPNTEKTSKDPASARSLKLKGSNASLAESKSANSQSSHPLNSTWVFWYRPPITKSTVYVDYEKTLHAMAGFSTVEEFFTIYRHLKRPSSLPLVSDYHIFRKGIRPVWEDEENKKGGKWIMRLKKGVADRYWEDLLFAILGDQFGDASDELCGAVLSVRNGEDILSIWTRDAASGKVLKIRYVSFIPLGLAILLTK